MSKSLSLTEMLSAAAPSAEPIQWADEATQRMPLLFPEAQWVGEQEMEVLLGERIWGARAQLKRRVAHWMADGSLLAVIDTEGWCVAMRPKVAKALLPRAQFVLRPAGASSAPAGFRVLPLDDVLWMFGQHGPQSLTALPRGFLRATLSLKKMPSVSPERLAPRHYSMMRLLAAAPMNFEALRETLSANPEDLQRDLLALYLVRGIEVH